MSESLPARPSHPLANPSYPERTHYSERPVLEQHLKGCNQLLDECRRKLSVIRDEKDRTHYTRIYHQLIGARDQLADMTSRIPREAGDLYEEDHHLLDEALSAIERLRKRI